MQGTCQSMIQYREREAGLLVWHYAFVSSCLLNAASCGALLLFTRRRSPANWHGAARHRTTALESVRQ